MYRAQTRLTFILAWTVLLAAAAGLAQTQRIAGNRPDCVSASAQSIYNGTGYNHVVTVRNQCPAAVTCTVTTDVNPSPVTLAVPTAEARSINTFLSAPGYAFTPTVHCASPRR
jgi:hypothetical protein